MCARVSVFFLMKLCVCVFLMNGKWDMALVSHQPLALISLWKPDSYVLEPQSEIMVKVHNTQRYT